MSKFDVNGIYGHFIDGSAVCYRKKGKSYQKGLLFKNGDTFFLQSGSFGDFYDSIALINKHGFPAYLHRDGSIMEFKQFSWGTEFSEGRAFIGNDEQTVLIDTEGKALKRFLAPILAGRFNDGLARIYKYSEDKKFRSEGFIDRNGVIIIPFFNKQTAEDFNENDPNDLYSDGFIRIKINNKYAFIDRSVSMRIPYIYSWASRFQCGAAVVRTKGRYGFINKHNDFVLPSFFEDAKGIYNYMAPIKLGGRWGVITMTGSFILDCDYDEIAEPINGQIPIKLKGKWGLMDNRGEPLTEALYDAPFHFIEGLAFVKESGTPLILQEESVRNGSFDKKLAI